jgi:hypothetical protein
MLARDRDRRLAGAFRLRFASDVSGPIALGWSSHFGMGLFMPDSNHGTRAAPPPLRTDLLPSGPRA